MPDDVAALCRMTATPVICCGDDTDMAERVRRATAIHVARIDNFGGEAVAELLAAAEFLPRDYSTVKQIIYSIRQKRGEDDQRRPHEINDAVANVITGDLRQRGELLTDGQRGYIFINDDHKLIVIDREDREFKLLLGRFGLEETEAISDYVLARLSREALDQGRRTRVYRTAHFDGSTVYLYNNAHRAYRITADNVELVDNGSDGILFVHSAGSTPFTINIPPQRGRTLVELVLRQINYDQDRRLTANDQILLVLLWTYGLFFPELFPTRPILLMMGPPGSLKTFSMRAIGRLVLGEEFEVLAMGEDVKDFDAAITNEGFVVADNADGAWRWLEDRLAIAATGGKIKRRKYYTTNTLVEYRTH
jgi:hypothetical protein